MLAGFAKPIRGPNNFLLTQQLRLQKRCTIETSLVALRLIPTRSLLVLCTRISAYICPSRCLANQFPSLRGDMHLDQPGRLRPALRGARQSDPSHAQPQPEAHHLPGEGRRPQLRPTHAQHSLVSGSKLRATLLPNSSAFMCPRLTQHHFQLT